MCEAWDFDGDWPWTEMHIQKNTAACGFLGHSAIAATVAPLRRWHPPQSHWLAWRLALSLCECSPLIPGVNMPEINQTDRSLEILLVRLGIIRSNDLKIISVESASFTSSTAPVFTLGGVFCQCFAVPMGLMQLYRCIDHKNLHYPYSASWLSTPNWWFTTHCLLSISLGWLKVFEQKPGGTMVLTVLTYLLGETHQDRKVNPASLMMLYFPYFGVSLYITVSTATLQQRHVAKGNPLEMEVLTRKSSFILAIIHCRFTVGFPSSDSSRLAKLFTQGGITWPNGHSSVWPFGRALRWALAHGSWLVGTGQEKNGSGPWEPQICSILQIWDVL